MKSIATCGRTEPSKRLSEFFPEPGYGLHVATAYENHLTQEWARDLCDRVTQLLGRGCVRSTWWRIEKLTHPAIFAKAVAAASRADVLIISADAKEELPLDLYVWIDAWLPRRQRLAGALVALIGPEAAGASFGVRAYLEAVARRGGLDFLMRAHESQGLTGAVLGECAPKRAYSAAQILRRVLNGTSRALP